MSLFRPWTRFLLVLLAFSLCDAAYAAAPLTPKQSTASVGATTLAPRELVESVLRLNQGLTAMRAAVDAAQAQVEVAGALDDPMLSYMAAPNTFGYPGQGLNQNVQISQTFPWPGTLDLRSEAAEAEADSTAQQLADLRLQLAAQARAAYAEWYYVSRALGINAQNQKLVGRLRKVAGTAYAAGQASQQDVLQAEVEQTRLKNQALELKRRRREVRAKINALLNRAARSPVSPPGNLPRPQHLPAVATLQDMALNNYPALKSLDAQIEAGRDRVDLAEKGNYPNFKVMAGYNSLWDAPAKRLVIGASINIPFGGNHEGKIDAAHAKLRQSRAKLANARSQLLSDLEQSYAAFTQDGSTIHLYTDKLLPLANQNLAAAEADYRSGVSGSDFLNLITAEQQLLMAKLELARARADRFTQYAALNYQTGGALFPRDPAVDNQGMLP